MVCLLIKSSRGLWPGFHKVFVVLYFNCKFNCNFSYTILRGGIVSDTIPRSGVSSYTIRYYTILSRHLPCGLLLLVIGSFWLAISCSARVATAN